MPLGAWLAISQCALPTGIKTAGGVAGPLDRDDSRFERRRQIGRLGRKKRGLLMVSGKEGP